MSDETLELLRRYRGDFLFFAPRVLKVQTVDGRIEPFVLNGPQRILHELVTGIKERGRPVRIIALKARRMGFSTYFSGRFYHRTSWNHNRYTTQVTHEPEATDTLFKMVKRFYNFTPEWLRPQTLYNNTRLLEFNAKDGKGLNSAFRVATAVKEDFGSGQLLHYIHLSEVAKWPGDNVESLLTSILQCVPDDPESEVVFESTAKGIGGEFYRRFWNSRYRIWIRRLVDGEPEIEETVNDAADENNQYTSIFLPWFVFESYQLPVPAGFECTADEEELKAQYGLSDEQIYWRRMTIANKCNGSVEVFQQEYPANPMEAFLGTGNPVFDNHKIARLLTAVEGPKSRYECLTGLQQWIAREDGRLLVWEEPRAGASYIISADVAEGLNEGDFSCADVVDHRTGVQVAQWHGKCDPDIFAIILAALGTRYNQALLAPERNNHGLTVITYLVNMGYPNLYVEMVPDPPGKPRKRYGWVTTRATRPLIIDSLVSELREDSHGIRCRGTFMEMMSFKRQANGHMEADEGQHDDRVMSYAIAKHVRMVTALPKPPKPSHIKSRSGRGRRQRAMASAAWT